MKNLILLSLVLLSNSQVFASDRLENEIVCNKVHQSGSADNGLTVALQSNDISWVKNVQVTENGYLGPRVIGNVQVPLQPKTVSVNDGGTFETVAMVYEGSHLTLTIRAFKNYDGAQPVLTGVGEVNLRLPGYEEENVSLTCEYAN